MTVRRNPNLEPPGEPLSLKAMALGTGADLLQSQGPSRRFDLYLVGFHCVKRRPHWQMEAHHYCHLVNQDFIQCVLFDGNTRNANLIGIEYIISERLFDRLPPPERALWHPHNYEILSGQLVAPGLPERAERAVMRMLMNSYGKTWHTWHTGGRMDEPGHDLPLGEPELMWSFNREGECDPELKHERNTFMGVDEARTRQARRPLVEVAHPQFGVDALRDAFPKASREPPLGVRDVHPERG